MLVRIVRRFFAKIRISRAQKQFLFAFCRGDEVKDTKRYEQLCGLHAEITYSPLSSTKIVKDRLYAKLG
jgi:hypothetical protein